MKAVTRNSNLRSQLLRAFVLSSSVIFFVVFGAVIWFASQMNDQEQARYNLGITQTIAELVRTSVNISDYGETQRLLALVSEKQSIIPGVLTKDGDLLLSDYKFRDLFEPILKAYKNDKTCLSFNNFIGSASTLFTKHAVFCAPIQNESLLRTGQESSGILIGLVPDKQFVFPLKIAGILLLFAIIVIILTFFTIRRTVNHSLVLPLENLVKKIALWSKSPLNTVSGSPVTKQNPDELQTLEYEFLNLLQSFQNEHLKSQEAEKRLVLQNMAQQVAHDIRSPLAALDTVMSTTSQIPEDNRVLIRSSIERIRDIANNLIEKSKELKTLGNTTVTQPSYFEQNTQEPLSISFLSSLIEQLITEKRMQYRSKIGIEIASLIDSSSYGLFAKIQPSEFKRVLSNLINNSVEALDEKGHVQIALSSYKDGIRITIKDNGKGISKEILAKIGSRGETYGKNEGSGLGLYHARNAVESWNGKLDVSSEKGQGTSVTITLSPESPPQWFVSKLSLHEISTIVILDDDTSIHQVWRARFDGFLSNDHKIQVIHLSTPNELTNWVTSNKAFLKQSLLLIDHELLGYKETGLDLIQQLEIGSNSVLVTSRFEEKSILEKSIQLGVCLIPKGMAGFVPITVTQLPSSFDCVLIDNDKLVQMAWNISAQGKNKKIKVFSHPVEFFNFSAGFSNNIPIYIDRNLSDGIKGEEIAFQIFNLGFTQVYLTTGNNLEEFKKHDFLAGVCGKDPPFI